MNGNATIGLDHDKAQGFGQARFEAAGVLHGATSHYQSHGSILADGALKQGNVRRGAPWLSRMRELAGILGIGLY